MVYQKKPHYFHLLPIGENPTWKFEFVLKLLIFKVVNITLRHPVLVFEQISVLVTVVEKLYHWKLLKYQFFPLSTKLPPGGRGLHRLLIFCLHVLLDLLFLSRSFLATGVVHYPSHSHVLRYLNYVKVWDLLQIISVYFNYFTVSERI